MSIICIVKNAWDFIQSDIYWSLHRLCCSYSNLVNPLAELVHLNLIHQEDRGLHMGEQCDRSSQAKESDESFFEWEGGEVRTTIGENNAPHHTHAYGKVCLWRPIFHGQPIRDHYIGWNNSLLARWRRADGKSTFFPMPGHFIFKIMISSIRKVNRAIRYLKCQNP